MKFGELDISWLLWMVPLFIVFFAYSFKRLDKVTMDFARPEVLPEINKTVLRSRKKLKSAMIIFAVLLTIISAMRPQWGFTWHEVKQRGLNILIALDTSNSMLAEDVLPSRLKRSKLAIRDLVRKLKGDRVGLVAFSGTAFLQCPLTTDYSGFLLSLEDVEVNTIPVGGTSLSSAIYTSLKSYGEGEKGEKILIIITDGEDLEGGIDRAVAKAKEENVTIYCVGIGTAQGEIIPIRDDKGKLTFLKDAEGNVVKTRLNEEVLQRIALATGGMYVKATGVEFGLELIYDKKLSKLKKEEFKSRMEKKYKDRFQYFLVLAFLILLIEPFIGERKRGAR